MSRNIADIPGFVPTDEDLDLDRSLRDNSEGCPICMVEPGQECLVTCGDRWIGDDGPAERMFPDLPPHLAQMAYALIDAGLCFLTCPPDCRGVCAKSAEAAVRELPVQNIGEVSSDV